MMKNGPARVSIFALPVRLLAIGLILGLVVLTIAVGSRAAAGLFDRLIPGPQMPVAVQLTGPATAAAEDAKANETPVGGTLNFLAPVRLSLPELSQRLSAAGLDPSSSRPLSQTTDDFDADGYPDLAVGYVAGDRGFVVIYFGDRAAFAPTDASAINAIGRQNRYPQAFNEASFITVDDRPDFLLAGDFERTGRHDLIAAASGGQSLHQLTVGSNRNLTAVGTLPIEGRISSTSLGELSQSGEHADVAVAIEDNSGPAVLIFNGANRLLGQQPKLHTLPEAARSLAIGRLSADGRMNLAMIAGGKIMVLDPNQDQSIPEAISLPFAVRSVVIGDLVADRDAKMELAVTSDDGVVHILSHGILNTQPISAAEFAELRRADAIRRERPARLTTHLNEAAQGWTEWETLAGVSLTSRSGYNQPVPILGSGHDGVDLVTIDTVGNQLDLSSPSGDGQSRSIAAVSAPLDVMPMRLNVHSRPSLVVLLEGQFEPSLVMVAPSAVFNVTKTADTNDGACTVGDCSLREAVVAANANAGLDSITFAAGLNGTPIQLTRVGDDNTSANGDLDINDDVTILGNGPTNTIVQGSSSAAFAGNMGDKVFGINQDGTHTTLNVTIQDLTVRFTRNDIAVNGLFTQTGGAMDIFLTGTGAMPGPTTTLSNVTIDSNASLHSYGGGLNIDSGGTGGTGVYRGTAQITNSTISNNKTLSTTLADNPPAGGGVNLFSDKHNVTFTGCSITGNQTSADIRSNSGGINMRHSFGGVITLNSTSVNNNTAGSDGGGILIAGVGFETVNMTGGTITGNTALGFSDSGAAGGFFNGTNIGGNTTVSGVTISNNIATAGPSGTGGGIVDGANVPISISNCTITGNSADNGGAIATTNTGGTQTTTVTNSVITGNSATSGGAFYVSSGILSANLNYINSNTAATGSGITQTGGTATVINNWWGCDGFPNAAGCQTGSGTFDADPRIDLRLAAAPTSVLLGGASTLTADVIKNTDGTNTNGGNAPSVLVGRNFTFDAGPKGSINAPLVVAIPANGTVSKTFTANTNSAACGTALPSVALDNGTQTVSITVQCAELTIAKANNVSNSSVVGQQWTWTITVTNGGNASGTFANGTTVFTDNLPNGANISYGSPATAANATCSINGSNDLSCIASAGGVTIAPAGSITVTVTATGTTPATQTNPRAGGTVTVDPGDVVVESNEANNTAASNTVTVIKANTTTTITNAASLSSTPTVVGEAYAVQTSVTVNAPGAGTPGGTITVGDGVSSCLITLPATSCNLTSTTAGAKTISATYSGDTNFNGSAASTASHTVNKASTTTTITNAVALGTATVTGQAYAVNWSVTVNGPGSLGVAMTGNVTASDGVSTCVAAVAAGTCNLTSTTSGSKTITATYGGDANYNASPASAGVTHQVNKANTTVTITNAASLGTATVTGQSYTVQWSVTVDSPGSRAGLKQLAVGGPTGTVTATDGVATCTATIPVTSCSLTSTTAGVKSITATYNGDTNYNASPASTGVPHTVNKANTTTTITNAAALTVPTNIGQPYNVAWSVTVTLPGAGTPTGTVTASDGTDSCTAAIGLGQCALTSTTSGAKNITATYNGDSDFNASPPSVSAPHTVNAGKASLDFDGDGKTDYAVVRDSGLPQPNGLNDPTASDSDQDNEPSAPRDGTLGSMHRGYYFKLPGEKFDPLMPRLERPNAAAANQLRWLINTSGPTADLNILFGTLNDFPVPADYDGDGICDVAVWTGGVGAQFRVLTSASGFVTTVTYTLGNASSDPSVIGDYDGDGKADPAIMNANTGQFTYLGGATHATSVTVTPVGAFGGGFPIPGDYDGDGKYDFVLETRDGLNPTQAHFYQWINDGTLTPAAATNFVFGNYRDVIIPGDYDGDGKTDIGVASIIVNPVAWRIRVTPTGTLLGPFNLGDPNVDYTITGDYNGDQKGEITIWHPAGAVQFQSLLAPTYVGPTTNFSWGQTGDYPVAYFNAH